MSEETKDVIKTYAVITLAVVMSPIWIPLTALYLLWPKTDKKGCGANDEACG